MIPTYEELLNFVIDEWTTIDENGFERCSYCAAFIHEKELTINNILKVTCGHDEACLIKKCFNYKELNDKRMEENILSKNTYP